MSKLNIDDLYKGRLEQIKNDLQREYYKGKRKSKSKIAKLMQERTRIEKEMES